MRTLLVVLPIMLLTAGLAWGQEKAAGVPDSWERESTIRAITEWTAGCDGSERASWAFMVSGWQFNLANPLPAPYGHGGQAWLQDGFYQDGDISDPQFCDPSLKAWGEDYASGNLDEADAFMVATHGSNKGPSDVWSGKMREDAACGFRCNCDAYQRHIKLGDIDLEFLHLSSCSSMDHENWDEWMSTFGSAGADSRLHQINGFHGLMWISSSNYSNYFDFADDAFHMSIADSWQDNLYFIYSDEDGSSEECPVSMVVGNNEESADTRLANEQYNWVYDDPVDGTYFVWDFIAGCDPRGQPPIVVGHH